MTTKQLDLASFYKTYFKKLANAYERNPMRLVNKTTRKELIIGDVVHDFRNQPHILIEARPPHKEGSSGFVTLRSMDEHAFVAEYYAGVIDAVWENGSR